MNISKPTIKNTARLILIGLQLLQRIATSYVIYIVLNNLLGNLFAIIISILYLFKYDIQQTMEKLEKWVSKNQHN